MSEKPENLNIERIIEQKVKERTKELEDKVEKLEKELENKENEISNLDSNSSEDEISRRDFLKKAGTGAIGLSALALLPSASAFNIRTGNPLQYFNSSNPSEPNFKVNQSGDISGNNVNVTELVADSVKASNELSLPNQSATENKKIWVEEPDTNTSELKVRLKGDVKTIATGTTVPSSGILRWTLDDADTSGGNALDVWNDYDGTINGATTGVSGANQTYTTNEAYSFDGSNDDVETTSDLGLSDPYSIAFWVKFTKTSKNAIGEWSSRDNNNRLFIQLNHDYQANNTAGQVAVYGNNGSTSSNVSPSNNPNLDDGNWHHIVVVRDTSLTDNVAISVDGSDQSLNGSLPGGSINNSSTGWRLGSLDGTTNPYKGEIDDFRIYNEGLTAQERNNLYDTGGISG